MAECAIGAPRGDSEPPFADSRVLSPLHDTDAFHTDPPDTDDPGETDPAHIDESDPISTIETDADGITDSRPARVADIHVPRPDTDPDTSDPLALPDTGPASGDSVAPEADTTVHTDTRVHTDDTHDADVVDTDVVDIDAPNADPGNDATIASSRTTAFTRGTAQRSFQEPQARTGVILWIPRPGIATLFHGTPFLAVTLSGTGIATRSSGSAPRSSSPASGTPQA